MSVQIHPQDLFGDRLRLFRTLRQLNAAAFAATAGVYLCFDYNDVAAQLFRCTVCLADRSRDDSTLDGDAKLTQKFLALILVHLHYSASGNVQLFIGADGV